MRGTAKRETMHATFDAHGIEFTGYPFRQASVFPNGQLAYSAIRDVDPDATPPEVRTLEGETLFISSEQAAEFRIIIAETRLTVVQRIDVWHLLLEPFLDTEIAPDDHERTIEELRCLGISGSEVAHIRQSVKNSMLAYNGALWDWVHLGLFDLLASTRWSFTWAGLVCRLFPKRYQEFYWRAMEIADRGRNESR